MRGCCALREFGQPVVSRHRIDGDRVVGRPERRFLDVAAVDGRQRLAAGQQAADSPAAAASARRGSAPGRPRSAVSADRAERQNDFLSVDGAAAACANASRGPESYSVCAAKNTEWPHIVGLTVNYVGFRAIFRDLPICLLRYSAGRLRGPSLAKKSAVGPAGRDRAVLQENHAVGDPAARPRADG